MAQCLLHHGCLVLLKTGACRGLPIFFEVTTNWRAGCQKFACPVRREGRPESSSLPLSPPLVVGRFLDLIKPPPGELGDGATDDKHDCGCGSAGLLSLQKLGFL